MIPLIILVVELVFVGVSNKISIRVMTRMETKLEGVEELELVKNRLDGVVEN